MTADGRKVTIVSGDAESRPASSARKRQREGEAPEAVEERDGDASAESHKVARSATTLEFHRSTSAQPFPANRVEPSPSDAQPAERVTVESEKSRGAKVLRDLTRGSSVTAGTHLQHLWRSGDLAPLRDIGGVLVLQEGGRFISDEALRSVVGTVIQATCTQPFTSLDRIITRGQYLVRGMHQAMGSDGAVSSRLVRALFFALTNPGNFLTSDQLAIWNASRHRDHLIASLLMEACVVAGGGRRLGSVLHEFNRELREVPRESGDNRGSWAIMGEFAGLAVGSRLPSEQEPWRDDILIAAANLGYPILADFMNSFLTNCEKVCGQIEKETKAQGRMALLRSSHLRPLLNRMMIAMTPDATDSKRKVFPPTAEERNGQRAAIEAVLLQHVIVHDAEPFWAFSVYGRKSQHIVTTPEIE